MALHGVRVEDAFMVIAAAREGIKVGDIYEGIRRFDLRVHNPIARPNAQSLGELFVETSGERSVPLREVVDFQEEDGPAAVRRQDRKRTTRVDVNLRGRDLVSWVDEARREVAKDVALPTGYSLEYGGQFENFERAKKRLALVIPLSVAIIFAMLLLMFQDVRLTLAVLVTVPFAMTGGMLGLTLRGLSFSLSRSCGFYCPRRRCGSQRSRNCQRRASPHRSGRGGRRGDCSGDAKCLSCGPLYCGSGGLWVPANGLFNQRRVRSSKASGNRRHRGHPAGHPRHPVRSSGSPTVTPGEVQAARNR